MARGRRKSKKPENVGVQHAGERLKNNLDHHNASQNVQPETVILRNERMEADGEINIQSSCSKGSISEDACQPQHLSTSGCTSSSNSNSSNSPYGSTEHLKETNISSQCPARSEPRSVHGKICVDSSHECETGAIPVNGSTQIMCEYCTITFESESELITHCQSESHQTVVMSDGEKDWKYRPPPRGFLAGSYSLCENWDKTCKYGEQCVEAHSAEELKEWRDRYEYRHYKIQQAEEHNLLGKSYTECLLDKWSTSPNPDSILKEKVEYAEDSLSENQLTTTVSKDSKTDWTFLIKTSSVLKAVAMLQFPHRIHFAIKNVKSVLGTQHIEWAPQNPNEWLIPDENFQKKKANLEFKHSVCIEFSSDIYGTFRQTVAFDFGVEPLMVKHLCVDVRPASFATNVEELKKELFMEERWDESNSEIIKFLSSDEELAYGFSNKAKELLKKYPTPTPSTFTLTQSTVTERMITKNNYCSRMHELLGVEEMARYQQVARYNIQTKLSITKSYLLAPAGTAHSTAKFAQDNQMYAVMHLSQAISEDTAAGRLILNNCTSVLICAAGKHIKTTSKEGATSKEPTKRKVFEALIEDKGKNVIYLKLSSDTVNEYNITGGKTFQAEVQFQLNRLQYCEWHHAVDSIDDYKILFPETFLEPDIPWTPQRQWTEIRETKLNVKQKEAIVAITTPISANLPPVLIIGPFGTGKTYTLAQAIKQLLTVPDYRILVCTHSNSAADIYIHDYLHPYVIRGHEEARPLRIYYHKRWVSTVHPIVQKYCLIETTPSSRLFKLPSKEEVEKYRVIVVTLNMSMFLSSLNLPKGFFTHILLDEAAQAMECEAIMPLAMAGDKTRIVLAGDHMQLNPELFSPFAKERNLHMSFLERLYDHYTTSFPCKILLTENYRAHEAIIKFTSELFYDQKLVSSGKQPRHPSLFPLTFYSCRGEDVQETNSTGHYNLAEVYEIAERVIELKQSWPVEWGDFNDQSIGIMTPYADQVFRIRCELRRKSLGGISVERVLNVQGKQFRAIIISTVRTRNTCSLGNQSSSSEESEYGFLSNSKLLNTAITRAQSLVAVVGDPIALCSLGRCRKVWERYLQICDEHRSLFGIPWSTIQAHLDGVEFKPNYGLNPLAPEFVPMGLHAPPYRPNPSFHQPSGNDAFVFNGYHSHLAFFDQSQPGQCQQTVPFHSQTYGSGPAQVEGQIIASVFQPPYVHNVHPQQQLYGFYPLQQQQQVAQTWPLQSEHQYRTAVLQNQGLHSASFCGPSPPTHLMPQPPRVWQGNSHVVPGGIPSTTNIKSSPYDTTAGKLVMQGTVDIPVVESYRNSSGGGKGNGLMPNNGTIGFNNNCGPSSTLQSVHSNAARCLEPLPPQPLVPAAQQPHQPLIPQNAGQAFSNMRPLPPQNYAHQQPTPHQLPQVLPQGIQTSFLHQQGVQNIPCHPHLISSGLVQQPFSQNSQPPQVAVQSQHLFQQQQLYQQLQQQQHQHFKQQQQSQFQSAVYEQQIRFYQEQQRQQQALSLLVDQRRSWLGRVLTPLVNCSPEWNKLIPRGVNLLDMVDNKAQQEEWFNHLMSHGQADLARRFTHFMVMCSQAIVYFVSKHQQVPANPLLDNFPIPNQNGFRTPDSKQASVETIPAPSGDEGSVKSKPVLNEGSTTNQSRKELPEAIIMMKDLDPTYMLGSDPILNGGKSVWAFAQDELAQCKRNGPAVTNQSRAIPKSSQKSETFDSDDSGDELLSSINRQLNLQHSDDCGDSRNNL